MSADGRVIWARALSVLRLTQVELADALGFSKRTAARYTTSGLPPYHYQALARLLHPVDRAFAAQVAALTGTTLVAMGLEAPPAPPAPVVAAPPPLAPAVVACVVDAAVCAASDALKMLPADLRPGLLAAVARARTGGISLADLEGCLRAALEPAPLPPPSSAKKGKATRGRGDGGGAGLDAR